MDLLLGIFAVFLGLAVCGSGLWLFIIMLPIWGFIAGFVLGAAATTALFGDGFLATTTGIIIGLVTGLIGAAISYLYWYFAVLLAAGATGAFLGAALFSALGVDADWLLVFIAIAFGAVFIFAALAINYPVYLVIVNTAFAGAAIALAGLMLILNNVQRSELGDGVVWQRIQDNWWIWIIWVGVALVGMFSQIAKMSQVTLPEDKWTKIPAQQAATAP